MDASTLHATLIDHMHCRFLSYSFSYHFVLSAFCASDYRAIVHYITYKIANKSYANEPDMPVRVLNRNCVPPGVIFKNSISRGALREICMKAAHGLS